MTEESENSMNNALNQLISYDNIDSRLKHGEEINITLIYSKTRGSIIDGTEAVLGKMFDGSRTNFGITTGTSRGLADVLRQLNPDMRYNITTYSQANIIMLGALNFLIKKGEKLNGNITLYHTGSPKAAKVFDEIADDVNIVNGVTMVNHFDQVGSEHGKWFGIKGLISEMRDYDNNSREKRDSYKKIPFIGPSLMTDQNYMFMDLPNMEDFYGEYKNGIKVKEGKYEYMLTDIVRNNGLKGKNDTETKKNVKVFVENNHR